MSMRAQTINAPPIGSTIMILPNGTLVAVADGKHLKLYRNRGAEPHLDLVAVEDPDIDALNPASGGRHRHSGGNPDSDRGAEDAFAAAVAKHLNDLALGGHLGSLFVIADPRTLGEMRRHFHAGLSGKIVGHLAKDLTAHPVKDIVTAIRNA
jgi:protein required for attachment to host cells